MVQVNLSQPTSLFHCSSIEMLWLLIRVMQLMLEIIWKAMNDPIFMMANTRDPGGGGGGGGFDGGCGKRVPTTP